MVIVGDGVRVVVGGRRVAVVLAESGMGVFVGSSGEAVNLIGVLV